MTKQVDQAGEKYLRLWAEPEAHHSIALPEPFRHVLVIPAYGEGENLFETLRSIPSRPLGRVFVILVLNARQKSPLWVKQRNQVMHQHFLSISKEVMTLSDHPPMHLIRSFPFGALLTVNRSCPGHFLPDGQGVGLARKIGADCALALHAAGHIESHWIHCTDADVSLPEDYFERVSLLQEDEGIAAAVYPFDHQCDLDSQVALAMRLYEVSLRYYVLGLAFAGSPYAYQSMGSALALSALSYTKVRGFPKRNAAEDFYLLNKLAKVGAVTRLRGTPIVIQGRLSDRVPFGTGRALMKFVAEKETALSLKLYNPEVFTYLKTWITLLTQMATARGEVGPEELLQKLRPNLDMDAALLRRALIRSQALSEIPRLLGLSQNPHKLTRHLHTWFDAFRTLKLIHALRDEGLSSLPLPIALGQAPFLRQETLPVDLNELRQHLMREELRLSPQLIGVPLLG